jgi:hypothetical protein
VGTRRTRPDAIAEDGGNKASEPRRDRPEGWEQGERVPTRSQRTVGTRRASPDAIGQKGGNKANVLRRDRPEGWERSRGLLPERRGSWQRFERSPRARSARGERSERRPRSRRTVQGTVRTASVISADGAGNGPNGVRDPAEDAGTRADGLADHAGLRRERTGRSLRRRRWARGTFLPLRQTQRTRRGAVRGHLALTAAGRGVKGEHSADRATAPASSPPALRSQIDHGHEVSARSSAALSAHRLSGATWPLRGPLRRGADRLAGQSGLWHRTRSRARSGA